jgi:hypothetical protein
VIQRQLGHTNLGVTSTYPGHRRRRNHQHDPSPASANDPRHCRPQALTIPGRAPVRGPRSRGERGRQPGESERDPRGADAPTDRPPPFSGLFAVSGRRWLAGLRLPLEERETVDAAMRQIGLLDSEIAEVERLIAEAALASAHPPSDDCPGRAVKRSGRPKQSTRVRPITSRSGRNSGRYLRSSFALRVTPAPLWCPPKSSGGGQEAGRGRGLVGSDARLVGRLILPAQRDAHPVSPSPHSLGDGAPRQVRRGASTETEGCDSQDGDSRRPGSARVAFGGGGGGAPR